MHFLLQWNHYNSVNPATLMLEKLITFRGYLHFPFHCTLCRILGKYCKSTAQSLQCLLPSLQGAWEIQLLSSIYHKYTDTYLQGQMPFNHSGRIKAFVNPPPKITCSYKAFYTAQCLCRLAPCITWNTNLILSVIALPYVTWLQFIMAAEPDTGQFTFLSHSQLSCPLPPSLPIDSCVRARPRCWNMI